jgi:hypothetical protein
MEFVWDDPKNDANIRDHGFDFKDAWKVFSFPMMVALDDRHNYGEERWVGMGLLEGRIVVIVFTEPIADTIRVISLRKALSHERSHYEQFLKDRLDQG